MFLRNIRRSVTQILQGKLVKVVHSQLGQTDMTKIVIFGATGMTGLKAVEAAVKKDYSVRVFVRDPTKIPEHLKSKVEVFKGDVLEPDSVNDAIDGTDGVVVALGTRNDLKPTSDMSEGTKNIIDGMRQSGVKKISVCLSGFLLYEPEKVPKIFVDITEDHKRMLTAVQSSGLDYVAVCPPHIEKDEPSREVQVVVNATKNAGRTITAADLGEFLVSSLNEPTYYKAVVVICNVPKQ